MRVSLSHALLDPAFQDDLEINFPSIDIEQSIQMQRDRAPIRDCIVNPVGKRDGQYFECADGRVRFLKTHWKSPDVMDCVPSCGAAYFVRHPLDVFLSTLNYLYINSSRVASFADYFVDKTPKPVDVIAEDGMLEYYLDGFLYNRGSWPLDFNSGTWVENVREWTSVAQRKSIIVFSFDDVVKRRALVLRAIFDRLGMQVSDAMINHACEASELATSPDGRFYWRGGAKYKSGFIDVEKINLLERLFAEETGVDMVLPSYFAVP